MSDGDPRPLLGGYKTLVDTRIRQQINILAFHARQDNKKDLTERDDRYERKETDVMRVKRAEIGSSYNFA